MTRPAGVEGRSRDERTLTLVICPPGLAYPCALGLVSDAPRLRGGLCDTAAAYRCESADCRRNVQRVRLLALAVFLGLALIAGALAWDSHESNAEPDYSGYEQLLTLNPRTLDAEQLRGPFYRIRYRQSESRNVCYLIDVSTQYEGDGLDNFWVSQASC